MRPAAEKMQEKIYKTKFINPEFKIINNVTAAPEIEFEKIKKLLVEQIFLQLDGGKV